jgi:large-conductance mechanosensitive channel
MVIVSLRMTLILVFGTQAATGPTNVSYSMSQGATLTAGSIVLSVVQIVIIALSIIVMLRGACVDPLHAARQGDAGNRRQAQPGAQLRDQDESCGRAYLGDHRRAVRTGWGGVRD